MNKNMKDKLKQFVAEEQVSPRNEHLYQMLVDKIPDTKYWDLEPPERNTINDFIRGIKSFMLQEALQGKYSMDVCLDAVLVTALEAGWHIGEVGYE